MSARDRVRSEIRPLFIECAPMVPGGIALRRLIEGGSEICGLADFLAKRANTMVPAGRCRQGGADGKYQGAVCADGGRWRCRRRRCAFERNLCARSPLPAISKAQSRFGEVPPTPQFTREIRSAEPNAKMRPAEFDRNTGKKMLRMRSHFREKSSLVLRPERHRTFEILQHHRASSEANPIRPPMVPIKAGSEIATRRMGHFPERRFQNRGTPEVRLGF